MKLLLVGGGVFLGKAIAAEAVRRGHALTLFNRGRTAVELPAGVELIKGDRNVDVSALGTGRWDAAIDTCAYFPRQVRMLLEAIGNRVAHYTLVSSISAYVDLSGAGIAEDAPTAFPVEANEEKVTGATYGPLKGACERAARELGPSSGLVVRPGIIVGPDDPTGRFGYWVARVARGGEILAPGNPRAPLQFIDVRDLAAWLVAMAEAQIGGTFNAVGPDGLTWEGMLATAGAALGGEAKPVWANDRFLEEQGAKEWTDLPFYLPPSKPEVAGLFRINGAAARGRGLKPRPLAETVVDTADWLRRTDPAKGAQMGLTPAREAELLRAWQARLAAA